MIILFSREILVSCFTCCLSIVQDKAPKIQNPLRKGHYLGDNPLNFAVVFDYRNDMIPIVKLLDYK